MRVVRRYVNDSLDIFSSPEPSPAVVCLTMSKIACLLPFPFVDSAKLGIKKTPPKEFGSVTELIPEVWNKLRKCFLKYL